MIILSGNVPHDELNPWGNLMQSFSPNKQTSKVIHLRMDLDDLDYLRTVQIANDFSGISQALKLVIDKCKE